MTIWNEIYNTIEKEDISLIFLSIGSSMEYYDEITEENNQQYPCFLNKFNGLKLIILIDPVLEKNLKIEEYFIKKEKPLLQINTLYIEDNPIIRVFKNNDVIVYALNESIDYISYPDINNIYSIPPDKNKIYLLTNLCLHKSIKFILQDFSGNDTTNIYCDLLKIFNRDNIINNINMDVSQNVGGCRILLYPDIIKLDEFGNFIQEKYIELSKITNSKLFNQIISNRIDILLYPIIYYYTALTQNPNHELDKMYLHKISFIAIIYNIQYDENYKSPDYLIPKLNELIDIILKDIINARELENTFYDYIKSIIYDRTLLYNTMKVLKFN